MDDKDGHSGPPRQDALIVDDTFGYRCDIRTVEKMRENLGRGYFAQEVVAGILSYVGFGGLALIQLVCGGNCDGSSGNGCERAMNTSASCGTSCGTITNCTTLPHVGTTGCSTGTHTGARRMWWRS